MQEKKAFLRAAFTNDLTTVSAMLVLARTQNVTHRLFQSARTCLRLYAENFDVWQCMQVVALSSGIQCAATAVWCSLESWQDNDWLSTESYFNTCSYSQTRLEYNVRDALTILDVPDRNWLERRRISSDYWSTMNRNFLIRYETSHCGVVESRGLTLWIGESTNSHFI